MEKKVMAAVKESLRSIEVDYNFDEDPGEIREIIKRFRTLVGNTGVDVSEFSLNNSISDESLNGKKAEIESVLIMMENNPEKLKKGTKYFETFIEYINGCKEGIMDKDSFFHHLKFVEILLTRNVDAEEASMMAAREQQKKG